MLRRSACGMKRNVVGPASAHPLAGTKVKASAIAAAAARNMRAEEVIAFLAGGFVSTPTLRDPGSHRKIRTIKLSLRLQRDGAMSADHDVVYGSAISLLDRYRERGVSPADVTRLLLDRLDALQPKINAFCIVDRDGALAAARESERRWLSGKAVG